MIIKSISVVLAHLRMLPLASPWMPCNLKFVCAKHKPQFSLLKAAFPLELSICVKGRLCSSVAQAECLWSPDLCFSSNPAFCKWQSLLLTTSGQHNQTYLSHHDLSASARMPNQSPACPAHLQSVLCKAAQMIIHSFTKYWLNVCYVSGIILGAGMQHKYNTEQSEISVIFLPTVFDGSIPLKMKSKLPVWPTAPL